MKLYIGIDPGLDGAVAVLDEGGKVIALDDTPTSTVKKGKGTRRVYIESAMVTLLEGSSKRVAGDGYTVLDSDTRVLIENVHAMPGQGVTSMFSMGTGFGLWLGIAAALRIPIERVEPMAWKKTFGIPSGSPKGESIVRASRLFPAADLRLKKHHGRADALLLAEHLRRRHLG